MGWDVPYFSVVLGVVVVTKKHQNSAGSQFSIPQTSTSRNLQSSRCVPHEVSKTPPFWMGGETPGTTLVKWMLFKGIIKVTMEGIDMIYLYTKMYTYTSTFQKVPIKSKKNGDLTTCKGSIWHPNWKVQVNSEIFTVSNGFHAGFRPPSTTHGWRNRPPFCLLKDPVI